MVLAVALFPPQGERSFGECIKFYGLTVVGEKENPRMERSVKLGLFADLHIATGLNQSVCCKCHIYNPATTVTAHHPEFDQRVF